MIVERLKFISLNSALFFIFTLSLILISKSIFNIFYIEPYYVVMTLGYISIISIFVSILSTFSLIFFSDKDIIYFFGNIILTIALVALIKFTYIYDYSWDGMSYHLPSILSIQDGWNPFRDPPVPLVLTNTYPNGFWTLSAVYGAILGNPEYGKIINSFLGVTFIILSIHVMDLIKNNKILSFIVINCVLLSNVNSQFFTNYLDGSIFILFSLVFIVIFIHIHESINLKYSVALFSIMIVLINTKTSGLYFAIIAILSYFLIHYRIYDGKIASKFRESCHFILKFGMLVFVFGVVIVGWRPWVTNIIEYKSFFYPDPSLTISAMAPSNVKQYNVFNNIIHAVYGYHVEAIPPESAQLKLPFVVEMQEFTTPPIGPRSGGFGPLFGAIITLTILSRIFVRYRYNVKLSNLDYACIIIFCGCAVLPGAWWARFIPMVYLIPILLTVKILELEGVFPKVLAFILIPLFMLNFIPTIVFYQNLQAYAHYIDRTLNKIHDNKVNIVIIHDDPFGDQNTGSHRVWAQRLTAYDIPHRVTRASAACGEVVLASAFVRLCREKD